MGTFCVSKSENTNNKSQEDKLVEYLLSTSSGNSGYIDTGSNSTNADEPATTSSTSSVKWDEDYISKLSTGDCKAIASGDAYYCDTGDCKGIVKQDSYYCKSVDCKGVAKNDKYYCKTGLCKAWVTLDKYYCKNNDCKGIASGDSYYCESKQCKAIAKKDKYYCP